MVLGALWSGVAPASDALYHDEDPARALRLVARDADRSAADLRPAPLRFGGDVGVVGRWGSRRCSDRVAGDVLGAALRHAEQDALDGLRDQASRGAADALAMLACMEVPLRPFEVGRAHDLSSALAELRGERELAVAHAYQALVVRPDTPLELQVVPEVIAAAHARREAAQPSTLWLPPGLETFRVLVDGAPARASSVQVWPGAHVVQVLLEDVHTLAVEVPEAPSSAALVLPDGATPPVSLDAPDTRAWLSVAMGRWGAPGARTWFVVRRRVWEADLTTSSWQRYEARPAKAVRPALLALTSAGVVAGGVVAGLYGARWADGGRCGQAGADPAVCAPFVDARTGLLFDPDGLVAARGRDGGVAIAGGVVAVLSAVALGVVAQRAQGPRAVQVAAAPHAEGVGMSVAVRGVWP